MDFLSLAIFIGIMRIVWILSDVKDYIEHEDIGPINIRRVVDRSNFIMRRKKRKI